jgi:hypothetical protein
MFIQYKHQIYFFMEPKLMKKLGLGLLVAGVIAVINGAAWAGIGLIIAGVTVQRQAKKLLKGQAPGQVLQDMQSTDFRFTDEMIMRLAQRKGGLLSAPELAAQSSLSLAEAEQRLNALHAQMLVELRVTDAGLIVYDFRPNQISDDDKFNAQKIIE